MVIALLSLPVAVASRVGRSLWQVMAGAAVLSALFTTAGLVVGYQADLPPSAVTILLAGAVYLLVLASVGAGKRLARRRAAETTASASATPQ